MNPMVVPAARARERPESASAPAPAPPRKPRRVVYMIHTFRKTGPPNAKPDDAFALAPRGGLMRLGSTIQSSRQHRQGARELYYAIKLPECRIIGRRGLAFGLCLG